jgi:hypothetical protein
MKRRKSVEETRKEEIKEYLSKKKSADDGWEKVYQRCLSGEKVNKDEISFAMEMCNVADFNCLQQGLL